MGVPPPMKIVCTEGRPRRTRRPDFLTERRRIRLERAIQPGIRIEIAIRAPDRAEGDVKIEGEWELCA